MNKIKRALECAKKRGKVTDSTTVEDVVLDIISEVMEAREAFNAGRNADIEGFKTFIKEDFDIGYESCYKNTLPDELADIVIGCYTLAGMLGIEKDEEIKFEFGEFYEYGNFYTDFIKEIINFDTIQSDEIAAIIDQVYAFAKHNKIDLDKFIELKMAYNEERGD
jgi:NTP pyrophosphatase (non-canonical NTP hydrolase)